ncbi:phosphatidylserine decarboxylase family protein [Sulfurimonas sp.]|uniref:phosphatidylserine decarboxylase family protein n=1 Tax=Sulfurimonas sp. TaxID=2022749 RepID=UPI002AB2C2F2|nr:phosphatidylserine decarboxylase family protein [Sulfurimonas sp.]
MQEFKHSINEDPVIRMYINQMIQQVSSHYKLHPEPNVYLQSVDEMLYLINDALRMAPEYNKSDLVGCRINSILNWTMNVPAGFAVFRNERMNELFRKVLDDYTTFLNSEASLSSLNDGPNGWKSAEAKKKLNMDQYIYNPNDKFWGFKSWNDFFTRKFKSGMRPIAQPKNPKVIVSACDSEVYAIKHNVKKNDDFWIKSQPYSLKDMLDDDKLAETFKGGDVYQAFLSAFKYHRWHSPVSGTIRKAYIKQGTYYSGLESRGMDPGSPDYSQGYISHVATRAIIVIEADDPIGLMVVMPVGMAEISSCVINEKIKPGYRVTKGEELGYFQFGGSTYCLVFQPDVIKEFNMKKGDDVKMGQKIGVAK